MATVLVTGATGFIGGAITRRLVQDGHEVRILRRKNSNTLLLDDLEVTHCIGDVCDKDSLLQALSGCEHVYHVAAYVSFWRKEDSKQHQINVAGTKNMVESALAAGVQRFIHTSSVSALGYPEPDGYIGDENTAYNWERFEISYMKTKHLSEIEVLKGVSKGLPAVILNPGTVFGAGDINFNGGAYIRAILEGKLPGYPVGGTTVVDIDAVVHGHLAAAEKGRIGERYILGGPLLTYQEMFEVIGSVVGKKPPQRLLPPWLLFVAGLGGSLIGTFSNQRPTITLEITKPSTMKLYYSSEKAQRELDLPTIPFRVSVERAFQWYREKGLL